MQTLSPYYSLSESGQVTDSTVTPGSCSTCCRHSLKETERMKSTLKSRGSTSPLRQPPVKVTWLETAARWLCRVLCGFKVLFYLWFCLLCACYKGGTADSELMRALRERDEMKSMLEKYERHLSEIQANVRVLTAERDKTRARYQQVGHSVSNLSSSMHWFTFITIIIIQFSS